MVWCFCCATGGVLAALAGNMEANDPVVESWYIKVQEHQSGKKTCKRVSWALSESMFCSEGSKVQSRGWSCILRF